MIMSGLRAAFELKSLAWICMLGYLLTLLFGTIGYALPQDSYGQLLLFQLGDASGIMASVIGARYTGLRSQQVAASAFILMGITHGISLAGTGIVALNTEKSITLIMPMIPAMALMSWCLLFPIWLRALALLPAALFVYVYLRVLSGAPYFDWPTSTAYFLWNITEVLWGVYIMLDLRSQVRAAAH